MRHSVTVSRAGVPLSHDLSTSEREEVVGEEAGAEEGEEEEKEGGGGRGRRGGVPSV